MAGSVKPKIIVQGSSGGIADDIRQQTSNMFAISKHFDIFSNPNRLTPYRNTEADTNDGSTATGMKQYDVRNFQLGSDGKLYGIGTQPASTTRSQIFYKADPTTGNWTVDAGMKSTENASASWRQSFMEWGTVPAFLGFGGTTSIWKMVIGTSTWTNTIASVGTTITHVAQSVKAPDGNMYMFYNNKVVRVTPGLTVTDAVLVLPADGRITSATMYGNLMAIAWAKGTTLTSGGYSKLFLWNLVSSDVTEAVEWGEGQLMVVGNIEGRVAGITDYFMSSAFGINQASVIVKMYAGAFPQVIKEIKTNNRNVTAGKFLRDVVIKANKMYWVMSVPFNTTSSEATENLGIWAFGRKDVNSPWAITLDFIEESIDTANFAIQSFGNAGNYWFIAHSSDGSISKTDDQSSYTFTSFVETIKYNGGDINLLKRLIGVGVSTAPMPAAGQIVVLYKLDSDTTWKTIHTLTTDNLISSELTKIVSTGGNLGEFHEIQLRIQSTGGAEITGWKIYYEEKFTLLNETL